MRIIIVTLILLFISNVSFSLEINGRLKDECKYLTEVIERTFIYLQKEFDRNSTPSNALAVASALKKLDMSYVIETKNKVCD